MKLKVPTLLPAAPGHHFVLDLQGEPPTSEILSRILSILSRDGSILVINAYSLRQLPLCWTPKQTFVISQILRGRKNREIAESLKTSQQVVKNVCHDIFRIAGVHSRVQLVMAARTWPDMDTTETEEVSGI